MSATQFQQEAALMGRYCDGDEAAFHRLYALLSPRILGYLLGLVGERATAEDLLQQTFLKVHQARATYVRGANPVPWLYTIAHRTCLDELRRRKRAPVRLTPDGQLPEGQQPGAEGGGLGDESRDAGHHIALAELDDLPQNQREALILTKVHGHSIAQAALITGSTPGAIKQRAHRAYVTLRARIARHRAAGERTA